MNLDPAGSVYVAMGTYLLVYMLVGAACLGTATYFMARLFPRMRPLLLPGRNETHADRKDRDLPLARGLR